MNSQNIHEIHNISYNHMMVFANTSASG